MGGGTVGWGRSIFSKGDGSRLLVESQRELATQKIISLLSYHNPMRYYYFKNGKTETQQM